jgi:hypothetical protein
MINRGVVGCQIERKPAERGREGADKLKVSEIAQTPPPGQRENHEKYSAGASAAMRYSWKAT